MFHLLHAILSIIFITKEHYAVSEAVSIKLKKRRKSVLLLTKSRGWDDRERSPSISAITDVKTAKYYFSNSDKDGFC